MKDDCECNYCKKNVNEYFCIQCGLNFNECESFYKYEGIILCPKCYPHEIDRLEEEMKKVWDRVEIDRPFDLEKLERAKMPLPEAPNNRLNYDAEYFHQIGD